MTEEVRLSAYLQTVAEKYTEISALATDSVFNEINSEYNPQQFELKEGSESIQGYNIEHDSFKVRPEEKKHFNQKLVSQSSDSHSDSSSDHLFKKELLLERLSVSSTYTGELDSELDCCLEKESESTADVTNSTFNNCLTETQSRSSDSQAESSKESQILKTNGQRASGSGRTKQQQTFDQIAEFLHREFGREDFPRVFRVTKKSSVEQLYKLRQDFKFVVNLILADVQYRDLQVSLGNRTDAAEAFSKYQGKARAALLRVDEDINNRIAAMKFQQITKCNF